MGKTVISLVLLASCVTLLAQGQRHPRRNLPFVTDTPMVHDPVMAYEDSTYYLFATGMGIQKMTSKDRKSWTVHAEPVMSVIPKWTHDSVPGSCLGAGHHPVARPLVARLQLFNLW